MEESLNKLRILHSKHVQLENEGGHIQHILQNYVIITKELGNFLALYDQKDVSVQSRLQQLETNIQEINKIIVKIQVADPA